MMKTNTIQNALRRLMGLVLAAALLPGAMFPGMVSAEDTEGEPPTAEASTEDPTAETLAPGTMVIDDITAVEPTTEQHEIKTDANWKSPGVVAEDTPTVAAQSVESFSQQTSVHGDPYPNMYTMTVSTGIRPGDSVEYFAIRYKDSKNNPQTKYIFPEQSFYNSYEYMSTLQGRQSVWDQTRITGKTKGTLKEGSITVARGKEENARKAFDEVISEEKIYHEKAVDGTIENEDIERRHSILSDLGYTEFEPLHDMGDIHNDKGIRPLTAWSVDEYLFTTENPIKEVTSLQVFMASGSWTVQGMAVSEVVSVNGFGEYGFYSGKYFYGLQKKRVCEMVKLKSGTLTLNANGDRLVDLGGGTSSYFSFRMIEDAQPEKSPFEDLYSFRIDFADALNAGLESLLRTDISDCDPVPHTMVEDLALEIEYKDHNNWTRTVTMPVLLSVLGQYMDSGASVRTVGLAQRCDSLAFTGYLPEYEALLTTKLYVGKAARDRLKERGGFQYRSGLEDDEESHTRLTDLETKLENDYIALSGVSIYEGTCQMSNTPDGRDAITNQTLRSLTYTYAFSSDNPMYFYTTIEPSGYRINPGTSDTLTMVPFTQGNVLNGAKNPNNFLVTIKQGDMEHSGTSGDIMLKVEYQNMDGAAKETQYYNVRELVQDYMGYWPSTTNATGDFAYLQGASDGGYLQFPIYLQDAIAITDVEVTLGETADEWRYESIAIGILSDVGRRMCYDFPTTGGKETSFYRFSRTVKQTILQPFPLLVDELVLPGNSKRVAAMDGYVIDTSSDVDWSSMRYTMSYDQTKLSFGFAKNRKTYDIDVKVADDPDTNNINGDSGSSNYFYFQLQFANGYQSGVVLANQQLTSDAFRAGYDETFSISVNRDYGDVKSIRIIPEDASNGSQVFDKLNIDKITITEQSNGGAVKQYVVDPVGWVDIDYHDSAEADTVAARKGRKLAEVVKSYDVTYQQRVVNFLCEISTLPKDPEYLDIVASICADVEYVDTSGQPHTMSFDVVQRMYSYMGKTPVSFEGSAESTDARYVNMKTVSDPDWMLRSNHRDRFLLPPLPDVKSIKSITFYARSRNNKPAKWNVENVSLARVLADSGSVTLNPAGEYLRGLRTERLCERVKDKDKLELFMPAGMQESMYVEFEQNSIVWAVNDDDSWISAVSREPEDTNDTLNIFVYPKKDYYNIQDMNVNISAHYTVPYTREEAKPRAKLDVYGAGTSDAMFYTLALPANQMEILSALVLECNDYGMAFDHAIVQRVRSNVVINTYYVDYNGYSAVMPIRKAPASSTPLIDPCKQKALIAFKADTEEMTLFAEENDIAVSIKYTSNIDHGAQQYYSPYVYLTDQGINKITPGMLAELTFNVNSLKDIVGYRIVSYGALKANVQAALITNYSYSATAIQSDGVVAEEDMMRKNSYSFDEPFTLINGRIMETTEAPIPSMYGKNKRPVADPNNFQFARTPIELHIKTADAQDGEESGTNSIVGMNFNIKGNDGQHVTVQYEDIRPYIQGPNKKFVTGEEAVIRLLLPDCKELESIEVFPKDETGLASWKIESIKGTLALGDTAFSRSVNKTITQNSTDAERRISFKSVYLATSIKIGDKLRTVTNHKDSVIMEGGTTAQVNCTVVGGTGYTIDAKWRVTDNPDEDTDVTTTVISGVTDKGFTITAPVNEAYTTPQTYIITITSLDNDAMKDMIYVTVPAVVKEDNINIDLQMNTNGGNVKVEGATEAATTSTTVAPPAENTQPPAPATEATQETKDEGDNMEQTTTESLTDPPAEGIGE